MRYPSSCTHLSSQVWTNWLLSRIKKNHLKSTKTFKKIIRLKLGQQIGSRKTIPYELEFRCVRFPYTYTITYPSPGDVPKQKTQREQELEQNIKNNPIFNSSYGYPEYERNGYGSANDFIQGHKWRFAKKNKKLLCTGTRYEYTLIPPIVDVNTGNVLFNFYANAGYAHPSIVNGLTENDARFFEKV